MWTAVIATISGNDAMERVIDRCCGLGDGHRCPMPSFPGFFRGMLDVRARSVNDEMKLAAAHALAGIVGDGERSEKYITPSMFDACVVPAVAAAVAEAAVRTGVARKTGRK